MAFKLIEQPALFAYTAPVKVKPPVAVASTAHWKQCAICEKEPSHYWLASTNGTVCRQCFKKLYGMDGP